MAISAFNVDQELKCVLNSTSSPKQNTFFHMIIIIIILRLHQSLDPMKRIQKEETHIWQHVVQLNICPAKQMGQLVAKVTIGHLSVWWWKYLFTYWGQLPQQHSTHPGKRMSIVCACCPKTGRIVTFTAISSRNHFTDNSVFTLSLYGEDNNMKLITKYYDNWLISLSNVNVNLRKTVLNGSLGAYLTTQLYHRSHHIA